jgi:hypothetical protein
VTIVCAGLPRLRHRSRRGSFLLAVTAIAFLLLSSIAASHLHISPTGDEGCAVCAAFAGNLNAPPVDVPWTRPVDFAFAICLAPAPAVGPPTPAHLLPPTCGPPLIS